MSNISFSNPYLLLIGIALIAIVCIPFFLSIKRDGLNFHSITSLVCHVLIAIFMTLAFAEMTFRLVVTETNVYVLADVSYSTKDNYEKIDNYIERLSHNLPNNSKMGVICYGKDYETLVQLGEPLKSVSESNVDNSKTDLKPALEYTASLFTDNVVKRIVIISDGKNTNELNTSGLISDFESRNIYVDAIYIDSNIGEDVKEFQISDVEYNNTAFKNDDETVVVTIEANMNLQYAATLSIYKDDDTIPFDTKNISLTKGITKESLKLYTDEAGDYKYRVELSQYKENENDESIDSNEFNNKYYFNQSIKSTLKILYISSSNEEFELFESIHPDDIYTIDAFVNKKNVPYTLEKLCEYDQIVISNTDLRTLDNAATIISNLDTAVSEFGKSLITIGNTYIQNSTADGEDPNGILNDFGKLLPVNYNTSKDKDRLTTFIIDISKSMATGGNYSAGNVFTVAKNTACFMIDSLNETDYFNVVAFHGSILYPVGIIVASKENKEKAKKIIMDLDAGQATSIGDALEGTYNMINKQNFTEKQIYMISDGASYSADYSNIDSWSRELAKNNVRINVIHTTKFDTIRPEEKDAQDIMMLIKKNGNGDYYHVWNDESISSVKLVVFDKITENYKEDSNGFTVTIEKANNKLVSGITRIDNKVTSFYTSRAKSTATTVLQIRDDENSYPLYSTWQYGNGSVSSFASSFLYFSDNQSNGYKMISNISDVNKPNLQLYSPYTFEIETSGSITNVNVNSPSLNSNAEVELNVTLPNGTVLTKYLSFDSEKYITSFDCDLVGTYLLNLKYKLGATEYESNSEVIVSYLPEYDSFEYYDPSNLYTLVTNGGIVSEDGNLKLVNDDSFVLTYKYEFAPLLMILSCVLFVIDVAIRKLRWQDIKDIFKKKQRRA